MLRDVVAGLSRNEMRASRWRVVLSFFRVHIFSFIGRALVHFVSKKSSVAGQRGAQRAKEYGARAQHSVLRACAELGSKRRWFLWALRVIVVVRYACHCVSRVRAKRDVRFENLTFAFTCGIKMSEWRFGGSVLVWSLVALCLQFGPSQTLVVDPDGAWLYAILGRSVLEYSGVVLYSNCDAFVRSSGGARVVVACSLSLDVMKLFQRLNHLFLRSITQCSSWRVMVSPIICGRVVVDSRALTVLVRGYAWSHYLY